MDETKHDKASTAQGTERTVKPNSSVVRFDFRHGVQLTALQQRGIATLHEVFARRVTVALSGLANVTCELSFVSAAQTTYSEWLGQIPELTYLASLRVGGSEAPAVVQADLSWVSAIVDLVLGGGGKEPTEARELSEVEAEIFDPIMQMVCQELQSAWLPAIDAQVQFDRSRPRTESAILLPSSEKILCMNFAVGLPEAKGSLKLVLSTVAAGALLRRVSASTSSGEPITSQRTQVILQKHLLGGRFDLELMLPTSTLSVRELMTLEEGEIIVLQTRATEPIHLNVGGNSMFLVSPVRCGTQRGAQVRKILAMAGDPNKETL